MADSPIQRIKELDRERTTLLAGAKKEALDRAKGAIEELNELGFTYQLTEKGVAAARGRKGTRQVKAAPCPVCKFETNPPHDARRHRGQGKRKKAFSAAELAEMELTKV